MANSAPTLPAYPSAAPLMLGSAAFVFLNFALPIYARELGASATAIGGTYTIFTITLIFVRPLVGVALDRYGRRRFYVAAFAFYALAMMVFAAAEGLPGLYLARLLQGLGSALLWVSLKTMTADRYAEGARGEAMGRISALSVRGSMLGAFYGFTLVGMFPMSVAWQWAFAGYALLAAIGFFIAWRDSEETRDPVESFSTATPKLWAQSPDLLRLLGIVALTGFASALIEPIYLIYLQDKFDLSVQMLALCFFPAGIVFAVLPIYGGRIADRMGYGRALAMGVAMAGVISGSLPFMPGVLWIALFYTLFAVGWSLADPAEDALYASVAGPENRGQLFGYKEMSAGIGSALGPLTGGALYDNFAPQLPFVINGVLLLLCAACTLGFFGRLQGRSRRSLQEE